jgi:hypothetical protein
MAVPLQIIINQQNKNFYTMYTGNFFHFYMIYVSVLY